MNKKESKYFNTAICFDEALISLLNKKDIEYITVKEICHEAGFNRSTFYLHYEGINDLLLETIEYINRKFTNYFKDNLISIVNNIEDSSLEELLFIEKKYLSPYLQFIKENQKIFKAYFNNPKSMKSKESYNHLKKYIIMPILERYKVKEQERVYLIEFYINGIMAIIKTWIDNNCLNEIEFIEEIIIKCVLK